MEISKLLGSDNLESISYAPRGMKPVGTCTNPENGKIFVVFELPSTSSKASNFVKRLSSYEGTHYMSYVKKDPFSFDTMGFLASLGINVEDPKEFHAYALGSYAFRLLGSTGTLKSFAEALYSMEKSGRDEVRENNLRVILGSQAIESLSRNVARVIRVMASKGLSFSIEKLISDIMYKDSKHLKEAWVNEFFGGSSENMED